MISVPRIASAIKFPHFGAELFSGLALGSEDIVPAGSEDDGGLQAPGW